MGGTGAGPHSAAELNEAATHYVYERAAALCDAPAVKPELARSVDVLFRS